MKIATIGRGNIGGGLAKRWRATGHDVTEFGSEGGNATGSDAVLVAIPSNAIENAFTKVAGIEDAVVIDATNAFTGREEGFDSLAHQVKSHVSGPVAKAFNCNYAALYDEIDIAARSALLPLRGRERRGRGDRAADPRRRLPSGLGRRSRQRAHARGSPRSDDRDQRGRAGPVLLPLCHARRAVGRPREST